MKRKGFPSGMKYPFENPDATYPSPNGPKPILERVIVPSSISLSQVVMTNAPTQHMEEIAETEAQELPQSGSLSRSPNRGSAFGGRGYPRGRARGWGSGRGRGRGRGPGPGRVRGHERGRSCRVGRPRARRGLSDMNRTTATAATRRRGWMGSRIIYRFRLFASSSPLILIYSSLTRSS